MGFIASILLLSSAYNRIYPRKQVKGPLLLALLFLMLVVPLAILVTGGITDQGLTILLYFFACGSLIITGLNHSLSDHPAALAGTLLFAISFMAYPIRETFFAGNPYLTILGPFVAAGFSLIVLGLIPYGAGTTQGVPEQPANPPGSLENSLKCHPLFFGAGMPGQISVKTGSAARCPASRAPRP